MLAAVKTLEETLPKDAFYARALQYRLLLRHWPDDLVVQEDASAWMAQSRIDFDQLSVINSVDPNSRAYFEGNVNTTHVLARLATGRLNDYRLDDAQAYLRRQQDFALSHGFARWVVSDCIAKTLLYEATGKDDEALTTLESALRAAAHTGLLRVFVDECDRLHALLVALKPRLTDEVVVIYTNRLLDAINCKLVINENRSEPLELLSQRELEVLRNLASGLTYEEIGQQLYLSLNTVQFHVKNIYGKLLVNKRVQAIEKAREMKLI
jgi:ATP/maltotriose-dependent transcriptional regulator MalT